MVTLRLAVFAAALTLTACAPGAPEAPSVDKGSWALNGDASRLSYVSVKADEIAETNEFKALSGSVSEAGEAVLEIDLASVSTGVDIRNERMREVFFEVANNPKAAITAAIDARSFASLKVGDNNIENVEGTLSMKGVEIDVEAEVDVTRTGPDRVTVVTTKPVIVAAESLELTDGLAQLQELANLPSITPVVPVTFSLTFERE